MGFGVKTFVATFTFAVLLGCSPPRVAPKDHCDQEGRKVTKAERVTKALESLAKDSERLSKDWAFDGGVHFLKWRQNYLDRHPNESDVDIAYAYYAAYPACCDVTPPAYLDPQDVSQNECDNRVYENLKQNPGHWVVDVRIWRKLPRSRNPKSSDSIIRGLSTCNDKIHDRGFPVGNAT